MPYHFEQHLIAEVIVQKHNWLPSVVKSMTYEDIRFVMTVEMQDWKPPIDEVS